MSVRVIVRNGGTFSIGIEICRRGNEARIRDLEGRCRIAGVEEKEERNGETD